MLDHFPCPLHRSQVPLLKLLVIFIGFILVTKFCIRLCRLSFRPTTNFNAYMCTIVNEEEKLDAQLQKILVSTSGVMFEIAGSLVVPWCSPHPVFLDRVVVNAR